MNQAGVITALIGQSHVCNNNTLIIHSVDMSLCVVVYACFLSHAHITSQRKTATMANDPKQLDGPNWSLPAPSKVTCTQPPHSLAPTNNYESDAARKAY